MDRGSEGSVHESVEDNVKAGILGESCVHGNGSCELENNDGDDDDNRASFDVKEKVEMTTEVSPATSSTKKGFGLRKWKRIKRDLSRSGDTRLDSGKMVTPPMKSFANPSKRPQIYAEKQQTSEGSVSSTNPLGCLDFLLMLGNSRPPIDAGVDSENSEDHSSRSSTAASAPKIRHEKSKITSPSGKKLAHSSQHGQLGKIQSEAIKKARGEQVNIKEENSHSSLESNSHSSSFAFLQGGYSTSNRMVSERPGIHCEDEIGDEATGSEHRVSDGIQDDVSSPEDESADSSGRLKTERSKKGSCSDQDPLVESIIALQAAQEALQKEVLKFKEISSHADASVDNLTSDTDREISDVERKVQETSAGRFPFGLDIETAKAELEDLFQLKIEAEVEYLTISRMMRAATVNQIRNLEEQTMSASLKNKNKIENIYQDLASANETMKLQKRLCKYTLCFVLQLFCFLVILGAFISRLSPGYDEFVPT